MHFYLKDFEDTGRCEKTENSEFDINSDFFNENIVLKKNEIIRLWWTTKSKRNQVKNDLLVVVKFWVTPSGIRKIRKQCHQINDKGRIGRRRILWERHNGKVIKE